MNGANTGNESANELYASLSSEVVEALREGECPGSVNAGAHLIRHGEDPHRLVIISSGEVVISLPSRGASVVLGTAGPGKVLGLRSLISGELPQIDACCVCDCKVTTISKNRFMDALKKHPQLYFAIAKVLSADVEFAQAYLKSISRRGHAPRPALNSR
jgi:CRP-like cAMP-binding protein